MNPTLLVLGAALAPSTALPANPGLLENLEFQAVGLVIVMGALSAMYLLCAGVGAAFQRVERARLSPRPTVQPALARAPDAPSAAEAPAASEPAVADAPVVVIAAAVAAAVQGKPHRVVSVAPASVGWSLEGRRQLLTSHQLRK